MATVWLRLRADVRLRWRALAALALLLGIVGGVVLTAAAGARRTDTAYPRLLSWANAAQVDIVPEGTGLTGYYAALARLPQVAALSTQVAYQTTVPARHGVGEQVNTFSSPDRALGVSADRVKILQGRLFDPGAVGQAMIDPQLASLEHVQPGGTLHLLGVPDNSKTGNPTVRLAFRVTAIGVFDTEIVPANTNFTEPMALLSAPFSATRAGRLISFDDVAGVRLRPGASVTAFLSAAQMLAKRYPATVKLIIISPSDQVAATERAIRPQAVALAVFALLAGLIGLAVVGQLLARQLVLDSAEFPILRALGMTRASLAALGLARLAAVTLAGAVIAVAVAVAASPLMPIGPARLAEPAPGIEVNLAVLGAGLAGIALLPLAVLGRRRGGRRAGRGDRWGWPSRPRRPGRRGWGRRWGGPGRWRAASGCGWRSSRGGGGPRCRCAARWRARWWRWPRWWPRWCSAPA